MPVAISGISAGLGVAQTVGGLIGAGKAHKRLENLANQSPIYQPSRAIGNYYNEALNRYMQSPYNTQMYQQAMNNVQRNLGTGIGALQDRRSALAGVSSLVDQGNRSMERAGVQAEGLRNQNFATLGRAAGMKAGEDRLAYQYNQLNPWQTRMQLAGAKAAGMNQLANAGISNIFSGLGNISNIKAMRELYGGPPSTGSSRAMYQSPGTGLAYTGGADILHPVNSPADNYPNITY